jgi:hypothetical protein
MQFEKNIEVDATAERTLAYMADFSRLPEWEPTVTRVTQTAGDGPGVGAAYNVTMRFAGHTLHARYRCDRLNDHEVRFQVDGDDFHGIDHIRVSSRGSGALINYWAEIIPQGVLGKLLMPASYLVMQWNNVKLTRNLKKRLAAS